MFDLLDLIRKLLSQIIIGVRIIRWFGLMDELRYIESPKNLFDYYNTLEHWYIYRWYLLKQTKIVENEDPPVLKTK